MTITIWKDKDFKGASQVVTGNIRDLKDKPADKPGSIRMTDGRDAVLLFKNDDWHEGALFLRGVVSISDLGSAKEGGRMLFGNCVRSIRVTPFTLKLNVSIVKNGSDFPGIWPSDWWAEGAVNDVVRIANEFLLAQNALLQLDVARITFRNDSKHFNLTKPEAWKFPGDWKRNSEVDVIFVNRFEKEGDAGYGKFPCFGEVLVVAAVANLKDQPDVNMTNQDMAQTLVHELGHYLGLGHGTADKNTKNLMFKEFELGTTLSDFELDKDQIREMQDRLANHHTRRGDRID
jgi:hypothetical protein